MSNDEHWETSAPRRIGRFGLATLFVLATALAVAIAIGWELSKSEVVAYVRISRSAVPTGWPREWFDELGAEDYESFRRTQGELIRGDLVLIRALRDSSISHETFLARQSDPVAWLKKHLKFDFLPYEGELLRIRLYTHEPDDGVKIVDAVLDAYLKDEVEDESRRRNRTIEKLGKLSDEITEKVVLDKKDVASLETPHGADAIGSSPELELRRARIRQRESVLDELNRQLDRLQLAKEAPPRVRIGYATALR
jgi:hypothetical protein